MILFLVRPFSETWGKSCLADSSIHSLAGYSVASKCNDFCIGHTDINRYRCIDVFHFRPLILFIHFIRCFCQSLKPQIANEEHCFCPFSATIHHWHIDSALLSLENVHFKNSLNNNLPCVALHCLHQFPAESVINVYWLSHQAHPMCAATLSEAQFVMLLLNWWLSFHLVTT